MRETWVQDATVTDVSSIIMNMTIRNAEYIHNTGSKYITGIPKSGKCNDVGIYFRDPTGIGNSVDNSINDKDM